MRRDCTWLHATGRACTWLREMARECAWPGGAGAGWNMLQKPGLIENAAQAFRKTPRTSPWAFLRREVVKIPSRDRERLPVRPHQDILDADTNDVCEIDTCEHVENEMSSECPKETVFRVMGSQNCSELLRAAPRPRRGPESPRPRGNELRTVVVGTKYTLFACHVESDLQKFHTRATRGTRYVGISSFRPRNYRHPVIRSNTGSSQE